MTKLAQLQHPDPMHLEAAAGWIQLGDYDSANDELEKIRAEWRAHPDVLDLRWLIYSHHEQWDACLDIASAIVKMVPDRVSGWIHKAISLRRANGGGFENAKALLLEAAKLFPDDDTIQYNLACYTAPNWANWMPLKSIWANRTSLGMPSRSSLLPWMMRI